MAKLSTFMYANESQNETINGKKMQTIRNPLLALKPAFIPGQLSFSVVLGVTDFDFEVPHLFQYRLISPSGKVVIDTSEVSLPPIPENERQKSDGMVIGFDVRNVLFMEEGTYTYELLFDRENLTEGEEIKVKAGGVDDSIGSN